MAWKVSFAIFLVFIGCCSNVVFLELLIRNDSGAGNIITFVQFLMIAVEGFFFESRLLTKTPVIPLKSYCYMVVLFFSVSVLNNYALNFNIPLPLHMIFRSGSLITNMVLGIIILKNKYPKSKYIAVMMVTAGIMLATLASANQVDKGTTFPVVDQQEKDDLVVEVEEDDELITEDKALMDLFWMVVGVSMLTLALFMSAVLGIYQEVTYKRYGKHPKEAMFYTHAIPLPLFLVMAPDLIKRVKSFNQSDPLNLSLFSLPEMWFYLILNGLTQYTCISGVFILTTECPSLVVTLIITLRKFLSLLFSILYFQNPFTTQHWIGTALVFIGTALFAGVFNSIGNLVLSKIATPTDKVEKKE